ncbi:MAG: M48 family metallopeptidase [Actinomycetota bacterium]
MKPEKFDAMVKKLESYAQRQPVLYKLRVALLAVLGYAYIFIVFTVLLATLIAVVGAVIYTARANIFVIKFAFFLLVPLFVILQSLWVHIPPPQGLKLTRQQVPHLFELIDDLREVLKAPQLHRILLTPDFNAGIVQIPRLGVLGWQQNYLLIGLPLIQALSPEQFRAVLAHELGHLSRNHGYFAGWIYRVRKTWAQIVTSLGQSQHSTLNLFTLFFNWYWPCFNAYSFVLARNDEYEADRWAAKIAGSQHAAEALIQLEILNQFLQQDFWAEIYKQAHTQPEPPLAIFTQLASALANGIKPERAQALFEQALTIETNNVDTHPCLKERISALGYSSASLFDASKLGLSAASHFLGKALPEFTEKLELEWRTAVNYQWHERYTYYQETSQNLQKLETKALQPAGLTLEEAWQRAYFTAELERDEEAIFLLKSVIERQADHALANWLLGQLLLKLEDESGIRYLEKAMAQEPNSILPATQLICYFLQKQGRDSEAEIYIKRLEEHYKNIVKQR